MPNPYIQSEGLTKTYGEVHALEDCHLEVHEGEIFGLLGPNGSGKTTLLRLLLGFLKPTSGSAHIGGWDCYHDSVKVHETLTYMPAEVRLFANMSGREILRFFSQMHPAGDFARALKLADQLELDLSRLVAYCSTGMKQKIALVATLAPRTPLVILDEPTSALDPTIRRLVLGLLHEARREGRTILFSSHVLSETEASCDRVCILRRGQVVFTEALSHIQREHRIKADLLGELPPVPSKLSSHTRVVPQGEGRITIHSSGELSELFGWLATLPLDQVRIEPVSLQVVYDRFHGDDEDSLS